MADETPKTDCQGPLRKWQRKATRFALRLLVHLEAVWLDPWNSSRAIIVKIQGKHLRSRLIFAPLLGRTRHAYHLWRVQNPPVAACGFERLRDESEGANLESRIVGLVTAGEGLDETIQDLNREQMEARVITSDCPDRWRDICQQESSSDFWILPLESGDRLAHGAGAIYRRAAATAPRQVNIIYADDDLGSRGRPHFKPDWNAELFTIFDYLTGAAIIRCDAVRINELSETGWSKELLQSAVEHASRAPIHIPRILHHRKSRPIPNKPAPISLTPPQLASLPSASVIVPTRNRHDLLKSCLDGLSRTDYPKKLDITVIDNGSDDSKTLSYLNQLDPEFARVLRIPGPFNFAKLINQAVQKSRDGMLCFLNNDIEIDDPNWLTTMVHQAERDDVGAVGAKLLYPNGRIQHAGVVLGIGGGAAHAHRLLQPEEEGYFHRHSLPQFVSAVTAACMVVRKDRFQAVGGFDAANFPVSFNDVDLCLKLNARGWHSLYEPRATLIHHESVSRGMDRDREGASRLARELAALQDRWGITPATPPASGLPRVSDPYHHPALSPFSERFVLDV